ncbi:conserved hypothetical protein [Xanthomonas phage OP2]|uniref:dATP/dGTP diphosphohydrolase N-terminal domain-containing protein n=1 Tax=Xanthomonas phage OP2 TaxID=331627 RepID=Q2NPA9_9CAUD|nr:hypothetical protein OP2_ORF23 [Xanthomonas phage OP2]BAE72787.1 conserved hypothetical protein [Xanthomonas phage OP2]
MNESTGRKFDVGKLQPRLLHEGMPRALSALVDVLTFGAAKYDAHNWLNVANGIERYQDASYRHDNLRCQGELCDRESGLRHRAHHIINELFVLELELRATEHSLATRGVSTPEPAPELDPDPAPEPVPLGEREILAGAFYPTALCLRSMRLTGVRLRSKFVRRPPNGMHRGLFGTEEAAEAVREKASRCTGGADVYAVVPVYKENFDV